VVVPVEDVEVSSEISGCHVIQVQAVLQAADVAPLGADHHVVVRLVPEVVSEQFNVKIIGKSIIWILSILIKVVSFW